MSENTSLFQFFHNLSASLQLSETSHKAKGYLKQSTKKIPNELPSFGSHIYVHVCVCMYLYIYVFICMCINMHVSVYIHLYFVRRFLIIFVCFTIMYDIHNKYK